MHTEQVIKRLKELELISPDALPLILLPNGDGTYTAYDQHHKGQVYTEEQMQKHDGPLIIWD